MSLTRTQSQAGMGHAGRAQNGADQEIELVAAQLGPVHGPMVAFAAATGLRPAELFALEHRDVDLEEGVVYVRRAYANGRVKHVKTRRSMRGVPLQGMALDASRRLPPRRGPLVISRPARRLHRPAQLPPPPLAAGAPSGRDRAASPAVRSPAHVCDLRAPRRPLSVRALALHGHEPGDDRPPFGHLASDGRQHAVALLDALAREKAVDAGWTPTTLAANPLSSEQRRPRQRVRSDSRGRSVDVARKTHRRPARQRRC